MRIGRDPYAENSYQGGRLIEEHLCRLSYLLFTLAYHIYSNGESVVNA